MTLELRRLERARVAPLPPLRAAARMRRKRSAVERHRKQVALCASQVQFFRDDSALIMRDWIAWHLRSGVEHFAFAVRDKHASEFLRGAVAAALEEYRAGVAQESRPDKQRELLKNGAVHRARLVDHNGSASVSSLQTWPTFSITLQQAMIMNADLPQYCDQHEWIQRCMLKTRRLARWIGLW